MKQLNALSVQSVVDKISFAEIYSHVCKENDNKSLPQVVNGNGFSRKALMSLTFDCSSLEIHSESSVVTSGLSQSSNQ